MFHNTFLQDIPMEDINVPFFWPKPRFWASHCQHISSALTSLTHITKDLCTHH